MRYVVYSCGLGFPTIAEYETLEAAYLNVLLLYLFDRIITGIWDTKRNTFVTDEELKVIKGEQ